MTHARALAEDGLRALVALLARSAITRETVKGLNEATERPRLYNVWLER